MWDFDTDSGLRLDIWPEEIDTTGFNLVFHTWSYTRIARIRVTWQAFGQAREEEKSLKSA
ncbi:MAG: H-type lectin domain-containing protein [Paracoccaceae bacterium]